MDVTTMSEEAIGVLRKKCLRSLYCFAVAVMGYDDIIEDVHGRVCSFLEGPDRRKQLELPRSFVKTWLGTIAYSIWIALPRTDADEFPIGIDPTDRFYTLGTNIRILIASNVISNAQKMVNLIRRTYERNQALQILFPEVIPDNFNKVKWSDTEACINRTEDFTESTFEAGGAGGSTTSRHYDLIIEDDLIYAKKDDLSGKELQPNQEDIDKAIGWHKLATSLLVPGSHTRIHNIGTRWAKNDLIQYIRDNEADYVVFKLAITKDGEYDGEPTWPSMYPRKEIDRIRKAQGPYMFATQYLGKPSAPEDMLFKPEWLQKDLFVRNDRETYRIFTTCDLSLWDSSKAKRKGRECRGGAMTCAWTPKNHCYILHYDIGRFDPSEMIDIFYRHYKLFQPESIHVESVYYQKALVHFTHKAMEDRGWLPLRELKQETNVSKELRIRAIEPYAMNLAIHCKPEHKDFITEWEEYSPNSHSLRDLIDMLAMQIQVARPGDVLEETGARASLAGYKFSIDCQDVLDKMMERGKPTNIFGKDIPADIYNEAADGSEEIDELLKGI